METARDGVYATVYYSRKEIDVHVMMVASCVIQYIPEMSCLQAQG